MDTKLEGKVLLTGASGFIGSRLRDRLLAEGVDVLAIRRAASPAPKRGRSVAVEYDDVSGLERVMADEKPDYVLHVAGVTKGVTYDDFRLGNVMPTENLLRAARTSHRGLKRFVLVSSLAAFGPSTPQRPLVETDPKQPVEFYGRSKMEAEAALEVDRSVPWTIARPSGVYGPGDVDFLELYKSASKGVNAYFGNKDRPMSIVYVDDCIDAILGSAKSESSIHKGYFLCDDAICTWGDYQSEVVRQANRRVLDVNLPEFFVKVAAHAGELATKVDGKPRLFNQQKATMGAQAAWSCRGDAARADFGFADKTSRVEGIRRTFAWYRENGWV